MRSHFLLAGLLLLFTKQNELDAQVNLRWHSSFSPPWSNGNTNGNAQNIGGQSVSCSTHLAISSGIYVQALGDAGAQTPTVTGATFNIPGSNHKLQVTPNFSDNTGYVDIIFNFSSLITDVSFFIADIDKASPTSTSYFDKVTITGTNGSTTFNPTITKYDPSTDPGFLVVSGNTAYVNNASGLGDNAASTPVDQRGTIQVNFSGSSLNSITVRLDNATGSDPNPAAQSIGIGEISFTQSSLPVRFISFNGHWEKDDVRLEWETEEERDALHYIIERNSNGSWEPVGNQTAIAANTFNSYSFLDRRPIGSVIQYRLKQVDNDGNFNYSSVIKLVKNTSVNVSCFPNPFGEQLSCTITSLKEQSLRISLINPAGQKINTQNQKVSQGINNFKLVLDKNITPGQYFLLLAEPEGRLLGTIPLLKN